MGRFGETALWVLIALRSGPAGASNLLSAVRRLDGPIGPGTLFGALARLEHLKLVERAPNGAGHAVYRLPIHTQGTTP
jgi:hypothetical protein